MRDLMKLTVTVPHLCYSYNMPAKKPKGIDWNGSLADFKDAVEIAGKVAYEVSGAGDVVRFAKDPSIKNAAALGLTVAAYAAGPAAKAAQTAKALNAFKAVEATSNIRAAAAAADAIKTSRVVAATKGAGTITTKSGVALPMTGIKTFSTAKNPVRAAASTRVVVTKEAEKAAATVASSMQGKVTAGKVAGAAVASAKAGSTVSTQKQKNKNKR
jgi:hypothetical protein